MNRERWERIEQLFHAAQGQTPAKRREFLDRVCADDADLRRDVESLLGYETDAAMVLDRPALEVAARAIAVDRRERMIGRTLGHYVIEAWLGAGGMGEVYRATDTRLDRAVAVKVLSEHLSTHPDALSRFEIEAKAAAALSHPNILAIHDFGDEGGVAYAVAELLTGETLRVRLSRSPLDQPEALEIAAAIAAGLAAAHAKGITHRDLKPENIFWTEEGRIKILDFGLAQMAPPLADDPTDPGSTPCASSAGGKLMGTVAYMSPEQARGGEVDPRSDIFSFGSVLYEMIVGQRAFERETKAETLAAIRHDEAPAAARLSGTRLEPIVARCLRKDPADRFQSGNELLRELQALREEPRRPGRRVILGTGALAAVALASWALLPRSWRSPSSGRRLKSLAVLPLQNLSNDPEEEYFADGLTDVLIAGLAQISSLRVISRASVLQLKGTKKPVAEIARQLNVDGIVEGSVVRSGDRVRITAVLIDAATEKHLWARTYDRKTGDVLTLQSEVARAIAAEVQARLTPEEFNRLSRNRAVSPAALNAYLKGRFYWTQFTEESLVRSITNYEEAIRIDPGYAAAYSGLSESWTGLGWIGARPWEEVRVPAKESAARAIAIDNALSDAHAAAAVAALRDWDWETAEVEDRIAIGLNPSYATAHMSFANILRYLGRAEESIVEARRAVELDPLSALTNEVLASAYLSARQYDAAIQHCEAWLEVHPRVSGIQHALGWAYVYKKRYDKGRAAIAKSLEIDGWEPDLSPDLAYIDAVTGNPEKARKTLRRLSELAAVAPLDSGLLAIVHLGLGERSQALALLEEAYRRHSSMMTWLKIDPRFDAIRQEPAFQDLMRRVGLV